MTDSINMQNQTLIWGLERTQELQNTTTFIKFILFFMRTVKDISALHSFLTPRESSVAFNPD